MEIVDVTIRKSDRYGKKSRIYVSVENELPMPSGPLCSDKNCEVCNDHERCGGQREIDHKVWRQYRRAGLKQEREAIEAAVEVGKLPKLQYDFSQNAGCSMCPCSPGFIARNHISEDFFVKAIA